MTTARSLLIPPGSAGCYHCVQRCVRRAFLCGEDRYTRRSFEHRKHWVEDRLRLLGECFAVATHAYAVMSNHLHVVVQVIPGAVETWSDEEVAARWLRVFSIADDDEDGARARLWRRLGRIAGSAQDLIDMAKQLGQRWLKSIGLAQRLT